MPKKQQSNSPMDVLLKTTPEEFAEYMNTVSLGELKSISNYLKMEYERSNAMRQSLLIAMENAPAKDKKQIDKTVQNLMIILQLIEDRVLILSELEKERVLVKEWFSLFHKHS